MAVKRVISDVVPVGKCTVHLHGFIHDNVRIFLPDKKGVPILGLAKAIGKTKLVLHERHLSRFLPQTRGRTFVDIEMGNRAEGCATEDRLKYLDRGHSEWFADLMDDEVKKSLDTLASNIKSLSKKDLKNIRALYTREDFLKATRFLSKKAPTVPHSVIFYYLKKGGISRLERTEPNSLRELKKWHNELSHTYFYDAFFEDLAQTSRYGDANVLPWILKRPAETSLNLRDAYMAEKISVLAKKNKELHVITGSAHTDNVNRFLRDPKTRKSVIEFSKEYAPISYAELKRFRKTLETVASDPSNLIETFYAPD